MLIECLIPNKKKIENKYFNEKKEKLIDTLHRIGCLCVQILSD